MRGKALSDIFFKNAVMPYDEVTRSTDGHPSPKVRHERCDKTFTLYFNNDNLHIKQNGCQCELDLIKSDIEEAFGMTEPLPWSGGHTKSMSEANAEKFHVIVPPSILPGVESLYYKPDWSQVRVAPTYVYEYKDASGQILCWQCRYDNPNKNAKVGKAFKQYFLVETAEGPRFQPYYKNQPVDISVNMLYGLELYDPARPTLFVEGEKAANAARRLLPTWNILSWNQGRDGFTKIDFSFMRGTNATVWPDNDKPGLEILEKFANKLGTYGIGLKTVFDSLQSTLPEGWDLADEIPPNVNIEALLSNAKPVKETIKTNSTIQELDEYYRRIALGSEVKFVDLRPKMNKPMGLFYQIYTRFSMTSVYPYMISIPGAKREMSVVDAWLRNIKSEMLDGITFDPRTSEPVVDGKLNNFVGFPFDAVKPDRVTRRQLIQAYRLLKDLIPNEAERRWVLDYSADIFQNPATKPPTFLTLIGGQGVGKSLIIEIVRHVLGDLLYCAQTQIEEKTAFNGLESGTLLIYQDEIKIGARDGAVYDRLKSNITAAVKTINRKGIAQTQEPSYERRMFTSNHDIPFSIAHDDRRTTIIRINAVHQGKVEKFVPFVQIKKSKALSEGLMWFFLNTKIKSDLMIGLASEEKDDLVINENPIPEAFWNMFNECELPEWLARLFVQKDKEEFGQRPIRMGRTLIKQALEEKFYRGALNRKIVKQLNDLLGDDYNPDSQGRYQYVDERGMNSKGNNSYYTFYDWSKARAKYDKTFGKRKWKPITKLHLVVDNTKEEPEQQIL
jgi:hypothetical protein